MNDQIQLDQIRELFINAPESDTTRLLAVVGSVALMIIVLWLVRRRSLREEHTPIWIAIAAGLTLVVGLAALLAFAWSERRSLAEQLLRDRIAAAGISSVALRVEQLELRRTPGRL